MELTWTQFRRAHTGQPQKEVSELWTQYKEGTYKPKVKAESDPYEDYNEAYNIAYGGKIASEADAQAAKDLCYKLSKELCPVKGYQAHPTDGWTLWLGPTDNCILENHTQNVAFTITRGWWQMFGTGAVRVDTQVFDEQEQVVKIKNKFTKTNRLFTRYPILNTEVLFYKNMNDAPLY